ncbi:MAG: alpha/beta hydrolase [Acidobacteria bacterium]|nr:alpha/beta hydrolase [Acidobacteriota bacterium]MBI3423498.1 alpha/beta hydrolase [Acidobacteriota bacterium]
MDNANLKRGLFKTPDGYVHYREMGAGTPLMLLHQVPLSSLEFSEVQPLLAQTGRHVIAADLLGYGCSDAPARGLTLEDYADSIIHLLDGLGLAQADLLGVHTGAAVANAVAANYPARVGKLVLNGAPAWERWQDRYAMLARCQPFELDAEGAAIKWQWERLRQYTDDVNLIRRCIAEKLKAGPIWYPGYVAVFTHDFLATFARVQAPTLLLTGSQDMLVECSAPLKRLRPELREVVIEGGGNWLAWEQPARFAEEVARFLAE